MLCYTTVRTLCHKLLHGDLIPADGEHFPEVAADSGAGAGPGRPSESAALGLWHSGKLLHPSLSQTVRPPNAIPVRWLINHTVQLNSLVSDVPYLLI